MSMQMSLYGLGRNKYIQFTWQILIGTYFSQTPSIPINEPLYWHEHLIAWTLREQGPSDLHETYLFLGPSTGEKSLCSTPPIFSSLLFYTTLCNCIP